MFYSKDEVKLAREMQRAGLFWRVRIGHWYVTRDGFVGLVKGQGEGEGEVFVACVALLTLLSSRLLSKTL